MHAMFIYGRQIGYASNVKIPRNHVLAVARPFTKLLRQRRIPSIAVVHLPPLHLRLQQSAFFRYQVLPSCTAQETPLKELEG
jgi:hypothetical protein